MEDKNITEEEICNPLAHNVERAHRYAFNEHTTTNSETFKLGMQTGYIQGCLDQDAITREAIAERVRKYVMESDIIGVEGTFCLGLIDAILKRYSNTATNK